MKNNIAAAAMLIKLGADINVENSRQWTPMRVAQNKGNTEFIEFLQKHGAEK
jgi:ankyrin repeat protein